MPESGTAGVSFLVSLFWVVVESDCVWWLDFSFDSMLGWDERLSWWFSVLVVSELLLWFSLFFSDLEWLSGLGLLSGFCLSGFPPSDFFLSSDSLLSSDFLLKMPRSLSVRFSTCFEKALCFRISNSRSRSPKWLSLGSSDGCGGSEESGLVELPGLLGLSVLLEASGSLGLSESLESSVLSGSLSLIGIFCSSVL